MANYYNKDLYKILDISIDASVDDIKLAYRKLVRIYHPDVAGKNADISKFKEINEAYEILINEETRKKYDILHGFYHEKIKKEADKQSEKNNNYKYEEAVKRAKKYSEKQEPFTKSFNSALDSLFHKKSKKVENKEKLQPKDGTDIKLDISISYFEAMNGTNRKVNIIHTEPCPNCNGRIFINGTQCPMCNGSGQLSIQKKINIKIPKGVSQGSKIRIKKEGNKGLNGGKDGDLYLIVNIEKNPYFETEGLNILCNLPITPFEAVLGAEITIPVIGEKIKVKIPPMTSSGQKLKLSGLGLSNKSKTKKGDIIITILIKLPPIIKDKEKALYEKLRDISECDIRIDMENEQ